MIFRTGIVIALTLTLASCVIFKGSYDVQGFNAQGVPLGGGTIKARVTSNKVRAERDRICMIYPEATVTVINAEAGRQSMWKGPYRCSSSR